MGNSEGHVGSADGERCRSDAQSQRSPDGSAGEVCRGGGGATTPRAQAFAAGGGECDRPGPRPDKACARPVPQLAAPPRAAAPSRPPPPVRRAAANGHGRRRLRHGPASQWWLRSAARGSFAAKRIWRVKVARTLQAAAAGGGAGSSPRRGLPPWARAAAAACPPGRAGRERHGRSWGPRGRPVRAGAGGPARGRRAAAARLLADRHHLHRAGRQRPAGPSRPRRARRRPPRPRPAALRHAAGAPAHTQRAAPRARPPAGTDTRDSGPSALPGPPRRPRRGAVFGPKAAGAGEGVLRLPGWAVPSLGWASGPRPGVQGDLGPVLVCFSAPWASASSLEPRVGQTQIIMAHVYSPGADCLSGLWRTSSQLKLITTL